MRRLSRLLGLVLSLLFLQLQLVEGGYVCQQPAGARPTPSAMVGMAMGAGSMSAAGDPAAATAAPARHGDDQMPCRFPWAPSGCRDMAPCAPAALPSVVVTALAPAATPVRAADPVLVAAAPASLSRPPELPPPRA